MNCRSEDVLETTPTFYTEDGQAIVGDPIVMQPREMRFVTIESLIPPQHRGQHDWGGMSLSYFGGKMEMWAQITIPGSGQRNSTEVLFSLLNGLGSDTLEAVWFQPRPGKRVIALGNSSDTTIQSHLEFSDGEVKDIEIAPHASKYLRKDFESGNDGGESVKITAVGPAGALKVSGYIISKSGSNSHKMASSLRFYDTKSAVQPKLFSTNFHVKNETLHLMLKNTSTNSLNVLPTFRPTSGQGEAVILSPVILSAGETRELDLQELRTASNTRDDLDSVSVEVANDGLPGTLIGSLNSKNENNGVAYDIPLRDSGPKRISTGSYPWRLDDDYKSVVTITNVGSDPSRFGAELRYSGGRYVFTPQPLAVGETAKFNLKKIRDEAIPDSDGNFLPANVSVGQFKWSILGMVSDTSRLIGRSEVISKSGRITSSYSCNNNCPDSGPEYQVDSNPISVFSADYSNNNVPEYWHHEYGGSWSFASVMPGLHTGNTSIAESEMIGSTTAMRTDGYDAGSTYWYSGEYTYYYYYDGGSDCYMSPWYPWETSGPIEVEPRVQKIQYKTPGTSSYVDVSGTLYVLKDSVVEFRAIPDPSTEAFPSGKPVWSGSSGASGTGQTISVTSGTASSSTSDFKTLVASARSSSVAVNVVVYDLTGTLKPQEFFNGRSNDRYGLKELVDLGFVAAPNVTAQQIGGLSWKVVAGTGTIPVNSNGTSTYTAPQNSGSESLKLEILDGPSTGLGPSYDKTIVAPSDGYVRQKPASDVFHCQGYCSLGIFGEIRLLPVDVSFTGLWFREGAGTTQASGFYGSLNGLVHQPTSIMLPITDCNTNLGCMGMDIDTIGTYSNNTSFATGSLSWNIQWRYGLSDSTTATQFQFSTGLHEQVANGSGTATIEKEGSGQFTKYVNDANSNCSYLQNLPSRPSRPTKRVFLFDWR